MSRAWTAGAGAAVAFALVGGAGAAQAQGGALEKTLAHLCFETRADAARSQALATAEGWAALTDTSVLHASLQDFALTDIQARTTTADGRTLVLMTGHGAIPSAGRMIQMNYCVVAFTGMPPADARAQIRTVMGFDPVRSDEKSDLYGFTEHDGVRKPFTADQGEDGRKAAEAGDLSIVQAAGEGDRVAVLYGVATGVGP